jgi:glycosyltransferase involved in cell wall biosynthesis
MKVWLVQPAEPMPVEKGGNRLWRTGFTAQLLDQQGHEVVWWASQFSHAQKCMRSLDCDTVEMSPRYRIRFLKALGYRRNISLARLKDHRFVAQSFRKAAEEEPKPDIILASFPTIECCLEAVAYGQRHGVPVVVDVRDQWPDLFVDAVPSILRPLAKRFCQKLSDQADQVFRGATAITGNADQAALWGVARARRPATTLDRSFPMGYSSVEYPPDVQEAARINLTKLEIGLSKDRFTVVYGGAIGQTGDFDTILAAAQRDPSIQFVLAGVGDDLDRLRTSAKNLPNIVFTGWLGAPEMAELLHLASVGLVPYRDRSNFEGGITNKPVEYLAHHLPVVTTLKRGAMHDALETAHCGIFYSAGKPDELASRLQELKADPTRLKTLSNNAYALYEQQFRAEKVYGEMIEHLQRVIDAYRATPSSV